VADNLDEQFLRQAADEMTVEVIRRIQNRTIHGGTSYEGTGYESHSKNPLANKKYEKKYAYVRKKHGRTTLIRNYYLTGNMMNNIGRVKMIQQKGWIEFWIGGRGWNRRNDGSKIKNKELLAIHSNDQGVNLLGLNDVDIRDIGRRLGLQLKQKLQ
jgi:hypothetical protein